MLPVSIPPAPTLIQHTLRITRSSDKSFDGINLVSLYLSAYGTASAVRIVLNFFEKLIGGAWVKRRGNGGATSLNYS